MKIGFSLIKISTNYSTEMTIIFQDGLISPPSFAFEDAAPFRNKVSKEKHAIYVNVMYAQRDGFGCDGLLCKSTGFKSVSPTWDPLRQFILSWKVPFLTPERFFYAHAFRVKMKKAKKHKNKMPFINNLLSCLFRGYCGGFEQSRRR